MLITALALFYPQLFIAISTMHENLCIYTCNNSSESAQVPLNTTAKPQLH